MALLNNIVVVGAGIMGHSITTQIAARGRKKVIQIDPFEKALNSAKVKIRENVEMLLRNNILENTTTEEVLARITFTTDLNAAKDAHIVIEAVPENFVIKKDVYKNFSEICQPDCIIATNTSSLPVTRLAALVKNPERVIGTHFFQPAHLVPLVEVVQTEKTRPEIIENTMRFMEAIGNVPAHIKKDVPAFVANRLQYALSREAQSLVQQGVVSIEDLDKIVMKSFAPRMVINGIFEQRDLNGLDTHLFANEQVFESLEDTKKPLQLLKDKVTEGHLGVKSGKGFYDWTSQNLVDIYKNKNQKLIEILKFLNSLEK